MQISDEMVEKAAEAIFTTWAQNRGVSENWAECTHLHHSIVDEAREEARAALTAALAGHVVGWRDIKSAPKDGTHIIAAWNDSWPEHPHAEAMYFADGGWFYSYDGDSHTRNPTHWMPLPAPPSPTNSEDAE